MTSFNEAHTAPDITDEGIEAAAENLLAEFRSWSGSNELPVPVEVILEHFLGYELEVSDGGMFADPDCLGGIVFEDQTVTVNASIEDDLGRYSFTLAHEIGHHVLHRQFYFEHLADGETKIICREVNTKPIIERQADRFAAAPLKRGIDPSQYKRKASRRAIEAQLAVGIRVPTRYRLANVAAEWIGHIDYTSMTVSIDQSLDSRDIWPNF